MCRLLQVLTSCGCRRLESLFGAEDDDESTITLLQSCKPFATSHFTVLEPEPFMALLSTALPLHH